jgi:hypothetical protein
VGPYYILTRICGTYLHVHKSKRLDRGIELLCILNNNVPGIVLLQRETSDSFWIFNSVADPNSDPPDPHDFGPPGSGSISQRYGSGSGSFYHHAKVVRKTMIPTILCFFLLLTLKNDVNVPSKSTGNKQNFFYIGFCCHL